MASEPKTSFWFDWWRSRTRDWNVQTCSQHQTFGLWWWWYSGLVIVRFRQSYNWPSACGWGFTAWNWQWFIQVYMFFLKKIFSPHQNNKFLHGWVKRVKKKLYCFPLCKKHKWLSPLKTLCSNSKEKWTRKFGRLKISYRDCIESALLNSSVPFYFVLIP